MRVIGLPIYPLILTHPVILNAVKGLPPQRRRFFGGLPRQREILRLRAQNDGGCAFFDSRCAVIVGTIDHADSARGIEALIACGR